MTNTLTGMTTLGNITNEDSTKEAQLFQQPLPQSDSSSAILLDLFGASRTIKISGTYTGTTDEINTFIGELDSLINGVQTTSKVYHSDKSNADYNVLIQTVSWKSEQGAVTKLDYDITMSEGAS